MTTQKQTDNATPRPWRVWQDDSSVAVYIEIADGDDRLIAKLPGIAGKSQEANAQLIVTAVNSHAALLAVAEAAQSILDAYAGETECTEILDMCSPKSRLAQTLSTLTPKA